jgi:hypothetical protein
MLSCDVPAIVADCYVTSFPDENILLESKTFNQTIYLLIKPSVA